MPENTIGTVFHILRWQRPVQQRFPKAAREYIPAIHAGPASRVAHARKACTMVFQELSQRPAVIRETPCATIGLPPKKGPGDPFCHLGAGLFLGTKRKVRYDVDPELKKWRLMPEIWMTDQHLD